MSVFRENVKKTKFFWHLCAGQIVLPPSPPLPPGMPRGQRNRQIWATFESLLTLNRGLISSYLNPLNASKRVWQLTPGSGVKYRNNEINNACDWAGVFFLGRSCLERANTHTHTHEKEWRDGAHWLSHSVCQNRKKKRKRERYFFWGLGSGDPECRILVRMIIY